MRKLSLVTLLLFGYVTAAEDAGRRVGFDGRELSSETGKTVVAIVEVKNGRVRYNIDSKPLPPNPGVLLRAFGELIEQGKDDRTVLVVIDESVSLKEVWLVKDVAGKAGFTKFRWFVFGPERKTMTEFKFSPSVEYSADPPPG